MASTISAREAPNNGRLFYCHQCSHQWMKTHNSEFSCPECREGFIEEVSEGSQPPLSRAAARQRSSYSQAIDRYVLNAQRETTRRRRHAVYGHPSSRSPSRSRSPRASNPSVSIILSSLYNDTTRRLNSFDGFQQFDITSGRHNLHDRHSILGFELDDLVDSLFSSHRPSPLSTNKIMNLPKATITEEETNKQCAICFEDFKLAEADVRKLPCSHLFHDKCIFPWLKTSATCAVCRFDLNANAAQDLTPPASTSSGFTRPRSNRRRGRAMLGEQAAAYGEMHPFTIALRRSFQVDIDNATVRQEPAAATATGSAEGAPQVILPPPAEPEPDSASAPSHRIATGRPRRRPRSLEADIEDDDEFVMPYFLRNRRRDHLMDTDSEDSDIIRMAMERRDGFIDLTSSDSETSLPVLSPLASTSSSSSSSDSSIQSSVHETEVEDMPHIPTEDVSSESDDAIEPCEPNNRLSVILPSLSSSEE